jgi:thiamine-phosphate diphosphorylase/hydroxyethylthiazole kinase
MTSKRKVDYSVYLVTGRELLPPGKDYYESLRESLIGGVTLVQVREKTCDTGEFIQIAIKTKAICDEYNVPVLINDRVDVHLAAGTDGIHVGQTDAPLDVVRRLVGPHAIVGQSVGNQEDARRAVEEGADYVGIGAVWDTKSKDLKGKKSLGPDGVGEILDVLAGTGVDAVAIGTCPLSSAYRSSGNCTDKSRRYTHTQSAATATRLYIACEGQRAKWDRRHLGHRWLDTARGSC